MGLTQDLAKEKIFAPLRDRLGGKRTYVGYLISCPWCASHWIAFALVPLTGAYFVDVAPRWGLASSLLSWFLSSMLVVVVAAFMRVAFYAIDEGQGLLRRRQRSTEEETETQRAMRKQFEGEQGEQRLQ